MKSPCNIISLSALAVWAASALATEHLDTAHELDARATNVTYWPFQTFVTQPKLHPPILQINKSGAALADGYLFFGPGTTGLGGEGPKQTSPLIMTDSGELIWSAPNGTFSTNFKADTLDGKPVLSYWSGIELPGVNVGHFYGSVTVLNASYHTVARVCPKDLDLTVIDLPEVKAQPCHLDGHESYILPNGNIVFTAYNVTTTDLSKVNGTTHGSVWDCLFYVYDIKTMKQLYRWSALAHVPVTDTRQPLGAAGMNASDPFDYFHINSVQPLLSASGKDVEYYVVNARHTWSTYLVRASTGEIVWTLSGDTGGDFGALATNSHFRWQHDARVGLAKGSSDPAVDPIRLRMFNNYNGFQNNGTAPANGLVLALTPPVKGKKGSNRFLQADADPNEEIYSDAQGSNQPFSNGNRLLYYGFGPIGKEFGPKGDVRMTVAFGEVNQVQSYRMFRQAWKGEPTTKPAVAVKGAKGYVSWNGATEVTSYQVYEGETKGALKKGPAIKKDGFETSFAIKSTAKYVLVEALDGKTALRNSSVVAVGS